MCHKELNSQCQLQGTRVPLTESEATCLLKIFPSVTTSKSIHTNWFASPFTLSIAEAHTF